MGYKIGELIRWHERYTDDFLIKDVGSGVIVERCDESRYTHGPHAMYRVFRIKHSDVMLFEEIELERLSK